MISNGRRNLFVAMLVAALFALDGCNELHSGCLAAVVFDPGYVQLIYPQPNATNVNPNTRVLEYYSSKSVPIELSAGSAAPTMLSPTTLPSPQPSPAATPINTGGSDFAVSLPPLSAGTTYTATANVREVGCGFDQPGTLGVGAFTVR